MYRIQIQNSRWKPLSCPANFAVEKLEDKIAILHYAFLINVSLSHVNLCPNSLFLYSSRRTADVEMRHPCPAECIYKKNFDRDLDSPRSHCSFNSNAEFSMLSQLSAIASNLSNYADPLTIVESVFFRSRLKLDMCSRF